MSNELEIFDGMSFSDLTKDIYDNSKNKRLQLELLTQRVLVKSVGGSAEDSIGLTDQEKEELIETLQSTATVMQQETDRLSVIKEAKMKIAEN